jgi:hypothetical protein
MSNEELLELHVRLMLLYIRELDSVKAGLEAKFAAHYGRRILGMS